MKSRISIIFILFYITNVTAQDNVISNQTFKYGLGVGPLMGEAKSVKDASIFVNEYAIKERLGLNFSHYLEFERAINRRFSWLLGYNFMRTNSGIRTYRNEAPPFNDAAIRRNTQTVIHPFVINQTRIELQLKKFKKQLGSVAPIGRYWSLNLFIVNSKLFDIHDLYKNQVIAIRKFNYGIGLSKGTQSFVKGDFVFDFNITIRLAIASLFNSDDENGYSITFAERAVAAIGRRNLETYGIDMKLGFGKLF